MRHSVKDLRKEVHHLQMKPKKTEGLLQESRKNASEANKEATRSHNAYTKEATRRALVEGTLNAELAKVRQSSDGKAREAAARIIALETELKGARERIRALEEDPSWKARQAQCEREWSEKLSEARRQLKDAKEEHRQFDMAWSKKVSILERELKAAKSEIARLRDQLTGVPRTGTRQESEEVLSLRRTVGELSESVGAEKAETQRLRLQLVREQQAVKDAEAESEALRKRNRELDARFAQINRMYIDGLLKKRDLEEEIFRLKQALVEATEDSAKSDEADP